MIGVFGGSGFYDFLDDPRFVAVETPYGAPSAEFAVGSFEGVEVAFLPAARFRPPVSGASGPVPGQRLGDEGAGG